MRGTLDSLAEEYWNRIADHLATRFFYSVDSARWGPKPVEEFLTQRRSGHCETFATAMALVLREHGIPSRLVTGFAGGERGPFGSYYLVRGHSDLSDSDVTAAVHYLAQTNR